MSRRWCLRGWEARTDPLLLNLRIMTGGPDFILAHDTLAPVRPTANAIPRLALGELRQAANHFEDVVPALRLEPQHNRLADFEAMHADRTLSCAGAPACAPEWCPKAERPDLR